jgi:hypothetical protein
VADLVSAVAAAGVAVLVAVLAGVHAGAAVAVPVTDDDAAGKGDPEGPQERERGERTSQHVPSKNGIDDDATGRVLPSASAP